MLLEGLCHLIDWSGAMTAEEFELALEVLQTHCHPFGASVVAEVLHCFTQNHASGCYRSCRPNWRG